MYDVRLEEKLELTKLQIWLLEELQIMPKEHHPLILRSISSTSQ